MSEANVKSPMVMSVTRETSVIDIDFEQGEFEPTTIMDEIIAAMNLMKNRSGRIRLVTTGDPLNHEDIIKGLVSAEMHID